MNDTASKAEAATGGHPFKTPQDWENFFRKFGENGRTFRDFTQLTPESMEAIYMIAYNQYNGGKYQEAERIFRLLSTLDHFDERYWMGLGACRQQLKMYPEAIKAFTFLSVLDMKNPQPPLLVAKCHISTGNAVDAEAALQACIYMSGEDPKHAELKQQAENLLDLLDAANSNAKATAL